MTSPAKSGEYRIEPELETCALACACGVRTIMALPGDEPLRSVLAELSCPSCGRRGAMAFWRRKR